MYKFHTAQITQYGPPAIVVTTSFRNAGGYFKGESFVIFPAPHPERKFEAIRFEQKKFEGISVELNEEFVLDELLRQARIDTGLHIEKYYSNKAFLIPVGELKINEVDASLFVHLQVRGDAAFLTEVFRKTECDELVSALRPILDLERISNRVID